MNDAMEAIQLVVARSCLHIKILWYILTEQASPHDETNLNVNGNQSDKLGFNIAILENLTNYKLIDHPPPL